MMKIKCLKLGLQYWENPLVLKVYFSLLSAPYSIGELDLQSSQSTKTYIVQPEALVRSLDTKFYLMMFQKYTRIFLHRLLSKLLFSNEAGKIHAVPFDMKPLCCVSLWLRGLYCVPIQSPLIFASLSPCHCITLLPAHPHIHSVCLPVFPSISPFYSLTHSFSQMQWIGQTNPPVCPSAPSNIVNI